jgi:hypothetical protein
MTAAGRVYLSLGAVVLLILWAYSKQGINPIVTETGGGVSTGAQP